MLKQLVAIIGPEGKRRYIGLAILSVFSSLLQTAGVAAISLFFTVLLGGSLPRVVQEFVDVQSFTLLGVLVFLAAISGTLSSGLATYFGIRTAWRQYEQIAGGLLKQYLDNSYEWHIQQNSAGLINAVLEEARSVCGILQQWVMVLVRGTEVLFLTMLLVVAKPMVAVTALFSFAIVYWALFRLNRKFIREQGRLLVAANADRQKAVVEALNGIKAVKVADNGAFFRERFLHAARRTVSATVNVQYFSLLPKYFIECLLFGGIVGFVVLSQLRSWGIYESIPLLALYGAAALRMLPAAQQVYHSAVVVVAGQAVVEKVAQGLQAQTTVRSSGKSCIVGTLSPESIFELSDISYSYPNSHDVSLKGIDLRITRGEKLGIVGTTGAGKTTLVDVLLQLLSPSEGKVAISAGDANRPHVVAYVPQQVHFLDDSISANIAWGIPPEKRDNKRIEVAAKKARIHEHIVDLPDGYNTLMGEQGVRLSGGQRQRIGLARALYLDPALLVLDEASNALDPETERKVLDTIFEQDLTLVVIAHRLSTLRKCDRLLVMRDGRIVAQGSYDQLLEECEFFQKLADADLGKAVLL